MQNTKIILFTLVACVLTQSSCTTIQRFTKLGKTQETVVESKQSKEAENIHFVSLEDDKNATSVIAKKNEETLPKVQQINPPKGFEKPKTTEKPKREELLIKKPVKTVTQKPAKEYPSIVFSAAESANVRISPYKKTTDSSPFVIPLPELADEFCFPCKGTPISGYGIRGRSLHTGVDLKATPEDTVRSVFPGVVRMSKPYSGYGNIVVVRHYNGLESLYSHMSKNLVAVNQVVAAGEPLGLVGRTGRATTDHLHFEFRLNGQHFDPETILCYEKHALQENTLYAYCHNKEVKISTKMGEVPKSVSEGITLTEKTETTPKAKEVEVENTSVVKKTSTKTSSSTKVKHKVVKGDTLYGLSLKYKTTVAAICKLNGIKEKATLSLGQVLKIK